MHNDFTIISSNCIGARIYQELQYQYNTPFVGMFIHAPCYLKLLNNLELYLYKELSFVDTSRYASANNFRDNNRRYPIGLLGNDIELQFIHYNDENDAHEKWSRRLQRVNMSKLYFIFTDRDNCDETHLIQFVNLRFENKICFTTKTYPLLQSTVAITKYHGRQYVGDLYSNFHILERHFNYIDWLNGGSGIKKSERYTLNVIEQ